MDIKITSHTIIYLIRPLEETWKLHRNTEEQEVQTCTNLAPLNSNYSRPICWGPPPVPAFTLPLFGKCMQKWSEVIGYLHLLWVKFQLLPIISAHTLVVQTLKGTKAMTKPLHKLFAVFHITQFSLTDLCSTQASPWFTVGWGAWRCWKQPNLVLKVSSETASLLCKTPGTGVSAPLSMLGGATTGSKMLTLMPHGNCLTC